ncbi:MAG TPA: glycosyltransferase family 2 protein [Acidimicrobiales bacterium]
MSGPPTPPRVSLIIINYNTAELTSRLVDAVGDGADEVVVVDNASPQGPPRDLGSVRADTILLEPGVNLGYGSGANLGARHASGDVLVVANPDVSIDAGGLRRLAAAALEPGVGLVAPRFIDPDGGLVRSAHRADPGLLVTLHELCSPFGAVMARIDPEWHATLLRSSQHERAGDVHHVLGALMAVRATAFREVGGFDERFFLYREETDLCLRLRRAGWRIRHDPSVTAVHIGGASSDTTLPTAARDATLESHYRFIDHHWGTGRRRAAWLVGLASSAAWATFGRDRSAGRHALRWHVRPTR